MPRSTVNLLDCISSLIGWNERVDRVAEERGPGS